MGAEASATCGDSLSCPVLPLSAVPRVVAVSPQMRLVEDNPSSLSLVEIYKQRCAKKGIEHDNPISRYYDRLATVQARGTQASHQVLSQDRPASGLPPEASETAALCFHVHLPVQAEGTADVTCDKISSVGAT